MGAALYDPLVADEGNAVYARVAAAPPGRLLELPTLPPDAYAASVYLLLRDAGAKERPLGYATSAPPEAYRTARRRLSAHASWESVSSSRIETASRNRRGLHQNDDLQRPGV